MWYKNGGGASPTWTPYIISATAYAAYCVYAAGYACPAGSTNSTTSICPPGTFSLAGAGACTPCAPGLYGATSGGTAPTCSGPCAAGRFGGSPGLTSPTCTGACSAGYACPPGSTNSTVAMCSQGTFSVSGAGVCAPCAAGRFGASQGLPSPTCSGLCDPGSYGAVPGAVRSNCTGPCSPGYSCPAGSVVGTAVTCFAGTYSVGGAGACSPCSPGKYAADTARGTACDVDCPMGSYCPLGVAAPTRCPAGRYGSAPGLATSNCTASCPIGAYCLAGAVNPAPCPPGRFGNVTGMDSSACSGTCRPGYFCPPGSMNSTAAPCGLRTVLLRAVVLPVSNVLAAMLSSLLLLR